MSQVKKIVFCAALVLLTVMCTLHVSAAHVSSNDRDFLVLADEYFDTYYIPANPTLATQLGIHTYDDKLEDYSRSGVDRDIAALKKFETRVNAVKETQLDEQTRGDRELVLNNIRSRLLTLQRIYPLEKNPDYYSSGITNSAFVIMERQFAPVNERLRALVAREKLMLAVLQEARLNLKNPPRIYTEIALEQLPGIIDFFQNDVSAAFSAADNTLLKKQFSVSNAAVIKALQNYQIWLKEVVLPRSHGDFRIGADTYQKKLMYDEMVDTPLDKLITLGWVNMRQNQNEFVRLAKKIGPNKTTKEVLEEIELDHPTSDKLLSTFSATFDNLIKFIKEKKIITLPSDVRPIMEKTPPFLQAITFASMDTPGPFESKASEAYFQVTLPEKTGSKRKSEALLRFLNYPSIASIAVHEAYPGHYVQFLWMHNVHDRVRQMLGADSNAEGWAHYCEQMVLEEGFGAPAYGVKTEREARFLQIGQLLLALQRNARFIVGLEMHTGQMTFNQAIDFFVKEAYMSRESAMTEAKRGTSDPTYLYYTLGKLQILKLRVDLQKKEGVSFNLQQFHDDFMRQGYPPIKIVRKAMLHDDSPTL